MFRVHVVTARGLQLTGSQLGRTRWNAATVALEPLGRHLQALIAVRLQPKTRAAVERFRDFLATRPETLSLFVVSGSDDFLVQVAVRDTRHLEAFVLDHIAKHPHIADVRTSLVYEHLERRPVEPLDPT